MSLTNCFWLKEKKESSPTYCVMPVAAWSPNWRPEQEERKYRSLLLGQRQKIKILTHQIQLCFKTLHAGFTSEMQDVFNVIKPMRINHSINKLKEKKTYNLLSWCRNTSWWNTVHKLIRNTEERRGSRSSIYHKKVSISLRFK